jgi:hypothetical protein
VRAIAVIACVACIGCVAPLRIELPGPGASAAERRSAYRWSRIAEVERSRRGGRHAVLGDGRAVSEIDALRVVGDGTSTANALDVYKRTVAAEGPWLLGAAGSMLGGFGAAAVEGVASNWRQPAMMATTIVLGFVGMGLCFHRAQRIERRAAFARDVVFGDYNADLRAKLRLCTRDYQLVDCDAAN